MKGMEDRRAETRRVRAGWGRGLTTLASAVGGAWAAHRLTARWVLPAARRLEQGGLVRSNWAGERVPTAVGLLPTALGVAGAGLLGRPALAAGVGAAALAGWVDDVAGRSRPKGWRGHLEASLRQGYPTTGALKAGIITAAAVLEALGSRRGGGLLRTALAAASMALTANALNQLDTRPGRAAGAFLGGMALLALGASRHARWRLWAYLPMAGAVAAYLPHDARGRVMLGDSGANALGAALGSAAADLLDGRRLLQWVAAVAGANLVMNRVSLSGVLDGVGEALQRLGWGGRKVLEVRRMERPADAGTLRPLATARRGEAGSAQG